MTIFGSTRHIKVEGEYKDVEPNEKYLQLDVKSQWDFNTENKFLAYRGGFTYYIILASKSDNNTYSFYKRLDKEDITDEYSVLIDHFLK